MATETVTVTHDAIEERRVSSVSMMPEGIFDNLTAYERRDLFAYLQSATAPNANRPDPNGSDPNEVGRWHLLSPPWKSDIVYGESVTLLQDQPDGPLAGHLAFPVKSIESIVSANRSVDLTTAAGWQLDQATGALTFPADSPAPRIRVDQLFPPIDSPNSYRHRTRHPEQALLYGPGRWFHDHQIEVTYRPGEVDWQGPLSSFAEAQLPRTIKRLRDGESLRIGCSGDSIAAGGDASILSGAEPKQPAFPELVRQQLSASYQVSVDLNNRAVGGWSIQNGLDDLDALLAEKPQLIIVAYGMNDVGRRDPIWFHDRMDEFIKRVRTADPEIELVMVTPMLGHTEWIHTPREMFTAYRDQLVEFVGPGVALADVGAVWEELLRNKHDLDLTGNGLNHPNDFGHRLYAQVILGLLVR
jgi:lysophospholipase L1-like esterase